MLVLERWQMEKLLEQLKKQKPEKIWMVWENRYWPGMPANVRYVRGQFLIEIGTLPDLDYYHVWMKDQQPATFSMRLNDGYVHMHVIIKNINPRELELAVGMQYGLHHEDRG